ncbi:MAG: hypothetical protein U9N34_11360 [Candidatus Cloacimonadota bacterium]|nr:hypothetical protein [Candidatus Cloacimonadota bacterium]
MKKIIIFILLFAIFMIKAINISDAGYIIKEPINAKYYFDKGEYYIDYNSLTFIGTSIHHIKNGYVTLLTLEEIAPTWLRIYNKLGVEQNCEKLSQAINFKISQNQEFFGYYDGIEVKVTNTENLSTNSFKGTSIFALDNIYFCN